MLSHGNMGKVLSKRFSERRMEYKENPEGFSEAEKDWMESNTIENAGDAYQENFLIETQPASWIEGAGPLMVDRRKIDPLKGGRDDIDRDNC